MTGRPVGAPPSDPLDRLEEIQADIYLTKSEGGSQFVLSLSEAEALVAVARAAQEADDLLRRLAGWDMLTLTAEGKGAATADAPFWRSEIAAVRARLRELARLDGAR